MAEIIQEESGHKGGGKRRPKKHSTHIDMTPMVDLMCLLITFFMLTTAFSKSKVMDIILPEKIKDNKPENQTQVAESRTLNIILGENDVVYWYPGKAKVPYPPLQVTDFSKDGIRKIILAKNRALFKKIDALKESVLSGKNTTIPRDSLKIEIKKLVKADDTGPVILIKADPKAKYKNMVDIIDEMALTNNARYAIVEMNYMEEEMLKIAKGQQPPASTTTPK